MTSPSLLWEVSEWAEGWAVEEAFGIEAAVLNDDRIARALYTRSQQSWIGSSDLWVRKAIAVFGIDVARLQWDMTSLSLHGACEQTDPDHLAPKFDPTKPPRSTNRATAPPTPMCETPG